jgi:hypothetical protein
MAPASDRVLRNETGGTGFPPLVWGFFGLLSALALVTTLLTSTRILLFGRRVDATIVGFKPGSRVTYVEVAYRTETGEEVRSSRGGFNGNELYELGVALGRFQDGDAYERQRLIGAKVPVRYVPARPTMAHIARWVPLYRELMLSHVVILALGSSTVFCFRNRRGKLRTD